MLLKQHLEILKYNHALANKKIRRDFIKNQNAKVKIKKSKIAERMAEGKVGGENKLKVKNEK